ncbi:hypothetical protein FNH22_23000 [Fulvivirga sp. M361]|uniref:hypothetical protein n=1 Tax=Fulvivirga sp. M361 TaxID=2594266 RepID=UPI00117B1225|nr:hypothetical protein [Fulvivirga sp. M361]TRX52044.1 hypothetical protein FNH22_23000 [Fulvivirga sp. M361]
MIRISITGILVLVSCSVWAQHIRPLKDVIEDPEPEEHRQLAVKLKEQQRYLAALEHFESIRNEGLLTSDDKMEMGALHYKLRQYREAELIYSSIITEHPGKHPMAHYWLGFMHKAQGKYDQARSEFNYFLDNNGAQYKKEAREAYKEIEGLKDALNIKRKEGDATVTRWSINGFDKKNMTSALQWEGNSTWFTGVIPIKYNKKIEVAKDLIAMIDEIQVSRIYITSSGGPKQVDLDLSDASKNIGSPSLGADKATLYFSACDQFGENRRCEIYVTLKKSNKWMPPVRLNDHINFPEYSSKTPNWVTTIDGKVLFFFSSNRPGGYGGYDIWVSEIVNGQFKRPVNLGAGVNTVKDEVSPFFDVSTGYLFLSSNGHHGLGEMDVFLAQVDWGQGEGKVYNLGTPINSGGDDYHFSLKKDRSGGFFSSNRDDNCCDHPYRFDMKIPYSFDEFPVYLTEVSSFEQFDSELDILRQPFNYQALSFNQSNTEFILTEDANIEGLLSDNGLSTENKKILLVDQKGEVVSSALAGARGKFEFRQLPAGGQYSFVLSEADTDLQVNVSLLNDQGVIFGRITSVDQPNLFRFKPLEDYSSGVWSLEVEDATISGHLLKDGMALVNEKVLLVNEQGLIVAATETDAAGTFDFKKLPAGERYSFVLEERDNPLSIEVNIKDRLGNVVRRFNSTSSREIFKYRILEEYEAGVWTLPSEEALISGSVLAGKFALSNKRVLLVDENGKVIGASVTDKTGRFTFRTLPAHQQFAFVLEENEAEFNIDIAVLDNEGNIISRFSNNNRQEVFKYRSLVDYERGVYTLKVSDASILGSLKDKNKPVSGHSILLVHEGNVVDKATTSNDGSFKFSQLTPDYQYTFLLEREDQGLVINLVVMNKFGTIVDRMDNKNRAEIFYFEELAAYREQYDRYYNKICGELSNVVDPLAHPVVLVDRQGNELACVETDYTGYFQFDDVTFEEGYRFLLDGCDTELVVHIEVDNSEGATRYRFNSVEHGEYFDYVDFAFVNQSALDQQLAIKKMPYLYELTHNFDRGSVIVGTYKQQRNRCYKNISCRNARLDIEDCLG